MRVLFILGLVLGSVVAAPRQVQRIVGGDQTNISLYPEMIALLFSLGTTNFRQACAGVILNNRSILTCAHCIISDSPQRWRMRARSTNANSGGTVYNANQFIIHNSFDFSTMANDIAIIRSATIINLNLSNIRVARIADSSYILGDSELVRAVGWGATQEGGAHSAQLRHVLLQTISVATCAESYSDVGLSVIDTMVCAGGGGGDQCQGDAGGPLYHNGVFVVGLSSFGYGCGQADFPGVNTRVSSFSNWIDVNA